MARASLQCHHAANGTDAIEFGIGHQHLFNASATGKCKCMLGGMYLASQILYDPGKHMIKTKDILPPTNSPSKSTLTPNKAPTHEAQVSTKEAQVSCDELSTLECYLVKQNVCDSSSGDNFLVTRYNLNTGQCKEAYLNKIQSCVVFVQAPSGRCDF